MSAEKFVKGIAWWRKIIGDNKAATSARVCERGHPMDPNWTTCAYCDAENRANERTTPAPEREHTTMERTTTKVVSEPGGPNETRGRTLVDTSGDYVAPTGSRPAADDRRITGVLATFSEKEGGEVFLLRQGRTVIGSGEQCDIRIPNDKMMSNEHAVILSRPQREGIRHEIHDMQSTNGTFLNGEYVERTGADLVDGALIKAGTTIFEFRKIASGEKGEKESADSAKSTNGKQGYSEPDLRDTSF